jgi:outer membrane protein TolC
MQKYWILGGWCSLSLGCASSPVFEIPPPSLPSELATTPIASIAKPEPAIPAYSVRETLPIDLPTVIRLVDERSPIVGFAQAKLREAEARLDGAEALWLPTLTVGTAYNRFDGVTQNQLGNVFETNRANLFLGGGPTLSIDLADAFYRPLAERRQANAERLRAEAVSLNASFDAVVAYFDLLQVYAQRDINADTLAKAEAMLKAAQDAREKRLDRTAGDVERAQSEVLVRRIETAEIEGRIAAASARLARQLQLPPTVRLVPQQSTVVPMTLIDSQSTLDQLVGIALGNRPDLAANREQLSAAWARLRRQRVGPWLPKIAISNQIGRFGGGFNDDLTRFGSRNALTVAVGWEFKNFGFGNLADAAERQAQLEQLQFIAQDAQTRAIAEIVEAAAASTARQETLELAKTAVTQAEELYRINREGTFNVVDSRNLFDALRPLQSIQVRDRAKQNALAAVIEFNKAQFRLFMLIGHPARTASSP